MVSAHDLVVEMQDLVIGRWVEPLIIVGKPFVMFTIHLLSYQLKTLRVLNCLILSADT